MKPLPVLAVLLLFPAVATAQQASSKTLVLERVIDAPVERVWAAFTDVAAITSWMAPHAKVDLRIGGSIQTNYQPGGKIGDPHTIVNKVLSYEPYRMLSIQNVKAPVNFPFAKGTLGTWTVLYFTPVGEKTKVRLVGMGWPATPAGDKAYAFFKRANAYSLAQLARYLAGQRAHQPKSDGSDVPKTR